MTNYFLVRVLFSVLFSPHVFLISGRPVVALTTSSSSLSSVCPDGEAGRRNRYSWYYDGFPGITGMSKERGRGESIIIVEENYL